jgi:Ion channel
VVHQKVVRAETIIGGICVYFLLGVIWAVIYSLLEQLQPGSLSAGSGRLVQPEQTGTLLVPDLLYYSVFVLTTIGPQEVQPISSAARAWTGVEAMTGQLFLVIFISRMVGMHGASASGR